MKNIFLVTLLLTFNSACKNYFFEEDSRTHYININTPVTTQDLSSLLFIEGFTSIQDNNNSFSLRGINKILFADGKLIILSNETDFQDILVFDEKSGVFLNKIGHQSDLKDGYEGLNDIILDGKEIRASVAGKMSFMNYDFSGKLVSTVKNGVFGEELELCEGHDQYIVYNEYNSSEISGLNHLLFYDKKGNLLKKSYPYSKEQDGNGYSFAGFLSKSRDNIWFNPSFCDTVYSVTPHKIVPRYIFEFGQFAMPRSVRAKKLTGWDTDRYTFLGESFVDLDEHLVFNYFEDRRIKLGVYDKQTGNYISFKDSKEDFLKELVQGDIIFPKENNSFALVLRSSRVLYMLKKQLLNLEEIERNYPELAMTLKNITPNSNPIILYLRLKPNSRIQENILTEGR
ncbi:MAG: hypothetical protein OHK0019_04020 [Saprospiraceae bacterium]